jgi:hypothetical protein
MRNGKFVGNSKLHDDYERRMRDEARAGFVPLGFLGRMIGGRIARVGMKGIAKSAAKTAAKAAAAHVVQRQVEKAMDRAEGTAGRGAFAHAGVIPLHMRIG